ncbi:MAG: protein phosphatase 2C domain-containing protein [Oscillospiraceae bacterium]
MKVGAGYMTSRKRPDAPAPERKVSLNRAGTYCDEDLSVIVVADGAVGTKRPAACRRAAKINVETMIAFFQNKWTWRITDKNEFKDAALRELMTAYEAEAKNGKYAVDDLSATVSAVALKSNGEFLAVSIGSGTVAALNHEMLPSVLIPPNPNKKRCVNHIDSAKRSVKAWGGTLEQSPFIAFAVYTTGAGALVMEDSSESAHSLRTAAACTLFGSGDEYISKMMAEIIENGENKDAALAVMVAESDEAIKVGRDVLLQAQSAQSAALEESEEDEEETEATTEETVAEEVAPEETKQETETEEKPSTKEEPDFAVSSQNDIPPVQTLHTDAVVIETATSVKAEDNPEIVEQIRTIIPEATIVTEVETEVTPEPEEMEEESSEPAMTLKEENITAVVAKNAKKKVKKVFVKFSEQELNEEAVRILDSVEPMYRPLLRALLDAPRSAGELVESGYCPEGRILETILPLIREGHVVYQDGVFSASEFE